MRFEENQARWLSDRHKAGVAHLSDALRGKNPPGGVDLLLTGFRSFTQDYSGRPQVNPTSLIMTGATGSNETKSGNWLPDVGWGRLGQLRVVTITANTDHNSPELFVEACRIIRPRMFIATGLGGSTLLETGATNFIRTTRPVYDQVGMRMDVPGPVSSTLSDDLPEGATLSLPWGKALPRIKSLVEARWQDAGCPLGVVSVAQTARTENDYICNATAWALAQMPAPPELAGFVHFAPMRLPREGYEAFALMLLTDIARANNP
ncbi:MAG: Pyroglutamyl peptidase [Pseudomonadota bacterium]